jgi:hypothetical protein
MISDKNLEVCLSFSQGNCSERPKMKERWNPRREDKIKTPSTLLIPQIRRMIIKANLTDKSLQDLLHWKDAN